jgi:hypothetical protein
MFICVMFCRNPMLLFFPSQTGRILQARQNFASPNFCLGSRERFGAEQYQIPEFPHAYRGRLEWTTQLIELVKLDPRNDVMKARPRYLGH